MICSRPFSPDAASAFMSSQAALERLFGFPFRMLRRHCLDPVEREGELEIDRLFVAQRPSLSTWRCARRWHEIGHTLRGNAPNEIDNADFAALSFQDGSAWSLGGRSDCALALPATRTSAMQAASPRPTQLDSDVMQRCSPVAPFAPSKRKAHATSGTKVQSVSGHQAGPMPCPPTTKADCPHHNVLDLGPTRFPASTHYSC